METSISKENFLEPETRDGVEVSGELKETWKVMLDMFEEFVRICDKYHLRYCMDGGSLLGAIRHKGFIPWDDDMDVSLPREDFQRFLEVAPKELSSPYFCQYTTTDPRHIQGFICLRNSATSAIDHYWADKKVCFNMGIGIDIFPLDDIPDDDAVVARVVHRQRLLVRVFNNFHGEKKTGIHRLRQLICIAIYKVLGVKRLVALRDSMWARFNGKGCKRCSTIAYNFGKARAIWPKEVYENRILVPFEYLQVYVPRGYETYLRILYGADWMTPIRGRGDHNGLFINTRKSYKETLVENFGYTKEMLEKLP